MASAARWPRCRRCVLPRAVVQAVSTSARIAALHYYPVKSAAGVELEQAPLTRAGFADDRRWMLVTDAGRFITQREVPRLALLKPQVTPGALLLAAPQLLQISIALSRQGPRRAVSVWQDRCEAFDEGDEAAAWLYAFLGLACRLVRFDPAQRRLSERAWTGQFEAENRFSDAFPILTLSAVVVRPEQPARRAAADEPLPTQHRAGRPAALRRGPHRRAVRRGRAP
ncbi:MAG: MOSC N-terminal beta barrel domain-containing protein [Steroidobacterales bacterium]